MIGGFQRSFLHKIIRNQRISNNQPYKLCHFEPWSVAIKKRRLMAMTPSIAHAAQVPQTLAGFQNPKQPRAQVVGLDSGSEIEEESDSQEDSDENQSV